MARRILTSLALLVTLAACGGGGDSSPPATVPPQAVAACVLEPEAAGQQVGRLLVASDTHAFHLGAGIDRVFDTVTFTNSAATPVQVQVQVSAQRSLATPATAGASLIAFVGVLDETLQQLAPGDECGLDIDRQPAAAVRTVTERHVYRVTVPAGHTFSFTPHARVLRTGEGAEPIVLTTTGYDLRLVAL